MYFCGIDCSCYTSSVCIVDENGTVLCDARRPLLVKDGQKGLRQSEMVFAHIKNLSEIFPEGFSGFRAVAASTRPRPQEGSYMPVFAVSESFGKAAAKSAGAAFYPLTHQHGHIGAALLERQMQGSFLALHVSGGTTDLLRVTVENDIIREILPLGGTQDIAAGQLVDRIGQALGLRFPAGPELTALAEQGEAQTIRSYVRGCNISFSGAETAAKRFLEQGMPREDVAASAMKCIGKTLEKLIINAREETGLAPVLLFGGVMSSTYLRGFLQRRLPELQFAGIRYAADNACGLAMQARNIYLAEGK